jgi:hypothetical protein
MTEHEIPLKNIVDEIKTLDNSENIDLIYYWNYSDDIIECYGSMLNNDSKNNHVLPCGGISNSFEENSEDMTLYGNIYILCKRKKKYINYHISDYGNFYYIMNEYYDVSSENESTDEEEEEDNVESNESNYNKLIYTDVIDYDSDNDLDIDNNDYT